VRRGTLITLILLFVLLAGAAIYQLTLGGHPERACGPESPNALPTASGACPTPTH
jgi:hypothetical protein